MSVEKRQYLIDQGLLRPDGSRVQTCPTCGQLLPEGFTFPDETVAEATVHEAGAGDPSQEAAQ